MDVACDGYVTVREILMLYSVFLPIQNKFTRYRLICEYKCPEQSRDAPEKKTARKNIVE